VTKWENKKMGADPGDEVQQKIQNTGKNKALEKFTFFDFSNHWFFPMLRLS